MGPYTFFTTLAVIVAVGFGTGTAWRRGLVAGASSACLLIGLVTTLICARMIHWLTNPSSFEHGLRSVFSLGRSNLSAFAGLVFGIPAAGLAARRLKINVWRLADSSTPALAFAAVLARIGCFLNGCCFGVPTRAPWGVHVPFGSEAHQAQIVSGAIEFFAPPLPVHPTQLYEGAAAMLGGFVAIWLLRRSRLDGQAFLFFIVWYTVFRWAISRFVYTPPSFAAPSWLYPALYILVILLCIVKLVTGWKAPPKQSNC